MSKKALVLLFLLFALILPAQVGPRSWQDHHSINKCNSLARIGNRMYGSYTNGIVYLDDNESNPQKLNKINGLSDVGVKLLRANPYNNKMLVIYDNSNIDIIDAGNNIINYPDLRIKTMSANKTVNEVYFDKNLAYLACGFGIVVFDMDRLEIRETYYIGKNGANVNVLQVALSNSRIFAASGEGLYSADRSSSLVNFNSWTLNGSGLFPGFYNGVINVNGTILCCKSEFLTDAGVKNKDSLFQFGANGWTYYDYFHTKEIPIQNLSYTSGNLFSIISDAFYSVINVTNGNLEIKIYGYNGEFDYGTLKDLHFYRNTSGNMAYWAADYKYGMIRAYNTWDLQQKVRTNGMNGFTVSNIDILKGRVAVPSSHIFTEGQGSYSTEGLNFFQNGEWKYLPIKDPEGKVLQDINSVVLDRLDNTMVWATSYAYGVLQYKDDKLIRTFTPENAGLDQVPVTDSSFISKHGGLTQDKDGNVWFLNSETKRMLAVIHRETGIYQSYEAPSPKFARRIVIDRNNTLWMPHEREGGITVFRHTNFNSYEFRTLTMQVDGGNLGSNSVYCVAEDLDGRMWVGTTAGIRVFYNPASIFNTSIDIDAQPIKIVQDGNVELLLGAETVTDIKVDGANNKWVGTASGGVYCFSPDGMKELFHFTIENSPLYSNSIISLNYDDVTGDLYIGSEKGLQTFRGLVISGSEDYSAFYAFPNPVRPGYAGTVLLRGLIDNSVVKITDVAGNMVWETKSAGGQIEWPLTNLSGSRVQAGIYLIYATTPTAEVKALTKVMVMN